MKTDLRVHGLLAAMMWGLCSAASHAGQAEASFSGTFSADRALISVYGGLEWKSPELSRHADFRDGAAHVEPLFESIFLEDGATKRLVIGKLTPLGNRHYNCHACSPLLGGAIFRQDGNRWIREAVGELIQPTSATHSSLQLLQIGPQRFAILHRISDVHGGVQTREASLIFGVGNELAMRFKAGGFSAPGPGACPLPEQRLLVGTENEPGESREYFDLIVDATWNEATCRDSWQGNRLFLTSSGKACRRVTRYRFREGSYQLQSTPVDQCTPLEERTVEAAG